jgi:DNA-binding response OmpR family regulator
METAAPDLVAIVDDEQDILDMVKLHLERAGFAVDAYADGEAFLSALPSRTPDLVLLDVMMPGRDGMEVCRLMAGDPRLSVIPVVFLTALGDEQSRVAGLEAGADDYIAKPFSARELVARARAVLRRMRRRGGQPLLRFGSVLEMDCERFDVRVEGQPVALTSTEFRLLRILVEGNGRVFSRSRLLDELWSGEKFVFDRTIDVHIRNLRRKLGPASAFLHSARGLGYRFRWP